MRSALAYSVAQTSLDPRVGSQARASLIGEALLAEISGANGTAVLQVAAALSALLGDIPDQITATEAPPSNPPPGILIKTNNGTGATNTITLIAPEGTVAVAADRNLLILAAGRVEAGQDRVVLDLPQPVVAGGYLIVYPADPVASYSGTVSTSYNYTLSLSPPTITATSWSPPPGLSQILVYGTPALSLAEVTNSSGAAVARSLKDFTSKYTVINVGGLSLPMSGGISVRAPQSWIGGDIKGGDVYIYVGA